MRVIALTQLSSIVKESPYEEVWHAMADPPIPFGERVRQRRQERGWTRAELAQRAQVEASTVSRLERGGAQEITLSVARRIARALGLSLDYLADTFGAEDAPSEKLLGMGQCLDSEHPPLARQSLRSCHAKYTSE